MYFIKQMLRDVWTYLGAAGTSLMVMHDWIERNINPVVALIGALLGLVLLVLGIIEKIKKNQLLTHEIHEYEEAEEERATRNGTSSKRKGHDK